MEAPPLERRLVAILAADVASYSRMMEIDEEGTLATLSSFRVVTDRLISQYEGRICGTAGDSILAAFGSALAAVQCAVDIQKELAQSNNDLDDSRRMQFRIGINVGDVMLKDGDIFGDGVNIAARLEGLADPGGICLSRGIHDHVMKKLPFEFEDLGEQSVKNIAQPVRVYRLVLDRRGSELRSSQSISRLPDVEADVPSLSEGEGEAIAPASDPQAVEIEFWDSIKNSTLASEYEAYLEQYPEGNFVALAQVRLEAIKQDAVSMRDPQDREIELSFWESVRESDNPKLIEAYLEKYPDGEFSALARIRVDELTAQGESAGGEKTSPDGAR
ncbi:MAG TPA: adenylate/guanylate cyclase domain-containing protein [Roseiarcus sp.]|nr:adenylate/guanylate cyclase domain-containing protein [Roseiarcus sp.]